MNIKGYTGGFECRDLARLDIVMCATLDCHEMQGT